MSMFTELDELPLRSLRMATGQRRALDRNVEALPEDAA